LTGEKGGPEEEVRDNEEKVGLGDWERTEALDRIHFPFVPANNN